MWADVSRMMDARRIAFTSARTAGTTLRIQPATPNDYRALTRFLEIREIDFHTYALPDERPLRVVVRGLPSATTTEDIKDDLHLQGFPEVAVSQMSHRDKRPMPIFTLSAPNTERYKRLFHLKYIVRLRVLIESPHPSQDPPQCHRCQAYGHTQGYCSRPPICHKCAGSHHFRNCTKSTSTPATCCNCLGSHPASYSRCPRNPSQLRLARAAAQAAAAVQPVTTSNRFAPLAQAPRQSGPQPRHQQSSVIPRPRANPWSIPAPVRTVTPTPPPLMTLGTIPKRAPTDPASRFAPMRNEPAWMRRAPDQPTRRGTPSRREKPAAPVATTTSAARPAAAPRVTVAAPASIATIAPPERVATAPPAETSTALPATDASAAATASLRGSFSLENVVSLMMIVIDGWTAVSQAQTTDQVKTILTRLATPLFDIVKDVYGTTP